MSRNLQAFQMVGDKLPPPPQTPSAPPRSVFHFPSASILVHPSTMSMSPQRIQEYLQPSTGGLQGHSLVPPQCPACNYFLQEFAGRDPALLAISPNLPARTWCSLRIFICPLLQGFRFHFLFPCGLWTRWISLTPVPRTALRFWLLFQIFASSYML